MLGVVIVSLLLIGADTTTQNTKPSLIQLRQICTQRQALCDAVKNLNFCEQVEYTNSKKSLWNELDNQKNNITQIYEKDDTSYNLYEFVTYENIKEKLEQQGVSWAAAIN